MKVTIKDGVRPTGAQMIALMDSLEPTHLHLDYYNYVILSRYIDPYSYNAIRGLPYLIRYGNCAIVINYYSDDFLDEILGRSPFNG